VVDPIIIALPLSIVALTAVVVYEKTWKKTN